MSHEIEHRNDTRETVGQPSVEEVSQLYNPDRKPEKKRSTGVQFGIIGGIATALIGGGLAIGSALGGEDKEAPVKTQPTAEAPVTPGAEATEPSNEATQGGEQEPGTKTWGVLELPEANSKGYDDIEAFRDFGSKEDFLNWFDIKADLYNTPELIAQKYIQNLEAAGNASLTYEYNPDLYVEGPDSSAQTAANIKNEYLEPIYEHIIADNSNLVELINTSTTEWNLECFYASLFDLGVKFDTPYATTSTYTGSELISGSVEDGLMSLSISYDYSDNSDKNLGLVGNFQKDIIPKSVEVQMQLDQSTQTWKIAYYEVTDNK